MVLVQKWQFLPTFFSGNIGQEKSFTIFFQLFLSGNIGQETVFYDILKRKKAFLGYKNDQFKRSKKLTCFQRG